MEGNGEFEKILGKWFGLVARVLLKSLEFVK
jgi:hypothetical protein